MNVDLSIFAEPIEIQLKNNGYKFINEDDVSKYNKLIKGWNILYLHSVLTDSESEKAVKKIVKMLGEDIVKIENQ